MLHGGYFAHYQKSHKGNSLVVQWLGLGALTAGTRGSIPGRGTKIPQAARHGPPPQQQQKRVIGTLE